MERSEILEILSSLPTVKDVSISEETQETKDILRLEGFLTINNLESNFVFRETPMMDIITIGYVFEYTLSKKERKESIYDVVNIFNQTKTGLKATLDSFSKGMKLGILFTYETITPHKSKELSELLKITTQILSMSPNLFSNDLLNKKINHKSISGK